MKRHVILVAAVVLAAIAAASGERPDYQALASKQKWEWSDDRAGITHSLLTYRGFHEVHVGRSPWSSGLRVHVKPENWIDLSFRVHSATVFVGFGDLVYWADYSPAGSGCTIRAYDLRRARYVWQSPLKGAGLGEYCRCRNRVRMELFEHVVMVWGDETGDGFGGRYVEIVDRKSGKTVGHKRFAKDAPSAALGTSPRPERLRDILYGPVKTCGKWSYQSVTERAHSRSRRTRGVLKYDGKEIKARRGERLWTPWGEMGWTIGFSVGWHPAYAITIREGKEIESPDPATSRRVKERWQSIRNGLDTLILTVEFDMPRKGAPSSRPTAREAFPSVRLHVPALGASPTEGGAPLHEAAPSSSHWLAGRIRPQSAKGLLSVLTFQGFLGRASAAREKPRPAPSGPRYVVCLRWKDGQTARLLREDLGWDLPVYERLCWLRVCLEDTEAAPLEGVLARCRSQLRAWRLNRLKAAAK